MIENVLFSCKKQSRKAVELMKKHINYEQCVLMGIARPQQNRSYGVKITARNVMGHAIKQYSNVAELLKAQREFVVKKFDDFLKTKNIDANLTLSSAAGMLIMTS